MARVSAVVPDHLQGAEPGVAGGRCSSRTPPRACSRLMVKRMAQWPLTCPPGFSRRGLEPGCGVMRDPCLGRLAGRYPDPDEQHRVDDTSALRRQLGHSRPRCFFPKAAVQIELAIVKHQTGGTVVQPCRARHDFDRSTEVMTYPNARGKQRRSTTASEERP